MSIQNLLEIARENLVNTDREIIKLLPHFQACSGAPGKPNSAYLASYAQEHFVSRRGSIKASWSPTGRRVFSNVEGLDSQNKLSRIENMAISSNTPMGLIAGVTQFMTPNSYKEKPKKFENLYQALTERHQHAKAEFDLINASVNDYRSEGDDRVVTFNPEQHKAVVQQAKIYAQEVSPDNERLKQLSVRVIEFCSLVTAEWQDIGINEQTGPFVEPVTAQSRISVSYPTYP